MCHLFRLTVLMTPALVTVFRNRRIKLSFDSFGILFTVGIYNPYLTLSFRFIKKYFFQIQVVFI